MCGEEFDDQILFSILVLFTGCQLEMEGFAGALNRLFKGEKIDVFASNLV
jgi:hypothetical protein